MHRCTERLKVLGYLKSLKMPKNAQKCPKMPKNAQKCLKMPKNA
jgi:hypothetical protein